MMKKLIAISVGLILFGLGAGRLLAQTEKTLLAFDFTDGNLPSAVAFDSSGNLWAALVGGGDGTACGKLGCGAVVELTPSSGAWVPRVVYSFHGGNDGEHPSGNLFFDGKGNVYGTTYLGGSPKCGCGTVYELTPVSGGWKETVIYRFDNNRNHPDGETPYAGVVGDTAGNLYGTTAVGGTTNSGTVYELTRNARGYWTEHVLWNFGAQIPDGSLPYSGLVADGMGNLYGTTKGGASGPGTVFELSPGSNGVWSESVIYNFKGNSDGANPETGLIFDGAGNLYGVTPLGGGNGAGTVYELSPEGNGVWTERVLYSFSDSGTDGYIPSSSLVFDAAGNLDGVTQFGGVFNWGTLFSLVPSASGQWSETQLYSFDSEDGANPDTTPVFDQDGNVYGANYTGGIHRTGSCAAEFTGCGVLFELKP